MMEMNSLRHTVGIIAMKDSFFLGSLQSKLFQNGINGIVFQPDLNEIRRMLAPSDPLIYYMGDEVFKNSNDEFLVGLRDMCLNHRRMLILIGGVPEYQTAIKVIPKSAIVEWFGRPIDIDALLNTLENCYKGKIKVTGKKHILIVDDDTTYMRMMHETLKDIYVINMLTSGKQMMLWLKEKKPDLILLDYEMPGENGVEVYNNLRAHGEYNDIPVIFLTGIQSKDSVMDAIEANPQGYILKSLDQEKLVDRLEEFFKGQSGNKPASAAPADNQPTISQDDMSAQLDELDKLFAELNLH